MKISIDEEAFIILPIEVYNRMKTKLDIYDKIDTYMQSVFGSRAAYAIDKLADLKKQKVME
jgi:hypothetical protein